MAAVYFGNREHVGECDGFLRKLPGCRNDHDLVSVLRQDLTLEAWCQEKDSEERKKGVLVETERSTPGSMSVCQ